MKKEKIGLKELQELTLDLIIEFDAFCQKNDIKDKTNFSVSDENNMILLGFIGFLDPPKESAYNSIKRLNDAGIRVIVLTR